MAQQKITAPRGTKDVLPSEVYKWHFVESVARETARRFGFSEIRFPTFEHTELFHRGVGDTTDIVQKEMYTFEDRGGRSITLRPEGTASVVRASVESSLFREGLPVKVYYIAANFRYEKPQAGRLREHHQFGVECFGAAGPEADADIIALAYTYLSTLGIKKTELQLNSIGCPECRKKYNEALKAYFEAHRDGLCETCLDRLGRNPLRLLDCKEEKCREINKDAPLLSDYLCQECAEHFAGVKAALDSVGIKYTENPKLVRGLDYYTRTVFEFVSNAIGAQGTVLAGGRYDGLVEELGGQPTPGLGFGSGIERVLLQMEAEGVQLEDNSKPDLFIAAADEEARKAVGPLVLALRASGVAVERDLMGRGVRAQMKYASKIGAAYTIVIGTDEIEKGQVKIRDMETGKERECPLDPYSIVALVDNTIKI